MAVTPTWVPLARPRGLQLKPLRRHGGQTYLGFVPPIPNECHTTWRPIHLLSGPHDLASYHISAPFTGEISDLVGVVQVQQERDIWLNKRDVRCKVQVQERALGIYGSIREMYGRLTPRLTYLNLFVTSSTQHRPLQLAPIGQTLRSADDHIPLLEPGFLWCLDITFRENLQYFDFLFSALK